MPAKALDLRGLKQVAERTGHKADTAVDHGDPESHAGRDPGVGRTGNPGNLTGSHRLGRFRPGAMPTLERAEASAGRQTVFPASIETRTTAAQRLRPGLRERDGTRGRQPGEESSDAARLRAKRAAPAGDPERTGPGRRQTRAGRPTREQIRSRSGTCRRKCAVRPRGSGPTNCPLADDHGGAAASLRPDGADDGFVADIEGPNRKRYARREQRPTLETHSAKQPGCSHSKDRRSSQAVQRQGHLKTPAKFRGEGAAVGRGGEAGQLVVAVGGIRFRSLRSARRFALPISGRRRRCGCAPSSTGEP